jgi:predicted nucleic acid-binding protein
MIYPRLLVNCDRAFCVSTYPLCSEHGIYSIDVLYLKVALDNGAVLVSLDKEDFIDKVKSKISLIEAYRISEFP